MEYYAGIGSRITSKEVCDKFTVLAAKLEAEGYGLRSGGAEGADTAFEVGVKSPENKIILRPRNATFEAIALAATFHPAWDRCNDHARKLHGRNAQIILGRGLDEPAKFVLCWTPDEKRGGTAMGLAIARANGIPVFNFEANGQEEFFRWVE